MSALIVSEHGAVGDGVTDNTDALARLTARCAQAGGGTIVVPAGRWLTGSVRLPSRTTLQLEAGAVLLGSRDRTRYPLREQPWEGRTVATHDPLVGAVDAEDVAITGAGVIDGQGADWWAFVRAGGAPSLRPRLLAFARCRGVTVRGVRLIDSPSWTIHPWRCRDVRVDGVTIVNPPDAPNTDGIDPESCADVLIRDCVIDVGDDAIVLKAGSSEDGVSDAPPCERITVSGCHIVRGHGGVVIGSEMSGGVRDVLVTGCVMRGTDRGIRLKTRRGRGGCVDGLTVSDVLMREVGCPLVAHMYYRYTGLRAQDRAWVAAREPQAVDARTPTIRNLRLRGLVAEDVTGPCLGLLYGIPERPIADVALSDCRLVHRAEPDPAHAEPAMMVHLGRGDYPTCGLFLADVDGLALRDVELRPRSGEGMLAERVRMR